MVDIAPRFYPTHHNHILAGLAAINLAEITSRKDAESIFFFFFSDLGEQQFILKNLYRNQQGGFAWRINVPVISKEIYNVGAEIHLDTNIDKPILLIRGQESSYVTDEDFESLKLKYSNAEMVTIPNANHWVHATNPKEFVETIVAFA